MIGSHPGRKGELPAGGAGDVGAPRERSRGRAARCPQPGKVTCRRFSLLRLPGSSLQRSCVEDGAEMKRKEPLCEAGRVPWTKC